jgi:hypothetical protein
MLLIELPQYLSVLDDPGLVLKLTGTGIHTCTWMKTRPKPVGIPLPMQYTNDLVICDLASLHPSSFGAPLICPEL